MALPTNYLETADASTILDLIAAEFESDASSVACFDLRVVRRAIELSKEWRRAQAVGGRSMKQQIFSNEFDLLKHVETLVAAGRALHDISIVTIHRPNGAGYYHPAYFVMWMEV